MTLVFKLRHSTVSMMQWVPVSLLADKVIECGAAQILNAKRSKLKEDVTQAVMYVRENIHLLHKHYYLGIFKERRNKDDHWLASHCQMYLQTFEPDDFDKDKIDVGADEALV